MGIFDVTSDKAAAAIVMVMSGWGKGCLGEEPVCQTADVAEATCRLITVFEVDKGRASRRFV